eukprot:c25986_g1_i2 orf=312-1847(-)
MISTDRIGWMFIGTSVAVVVVVQVCKLIAILWWRPLRIKRFFQAQGVHGPPYRFFYGNAPEIVAMINEERSKPLECLSHDIVGRVFPYYKRWSKIYGKPFLFWFGPAPRLTVSDPQLVREILSNKFGHYMKPARRPDFETPGLASLEGEVWAQHRRIINPAFQMESLKAMIPKMITCAAEMLDKWQTQLTLGQNEIDALKEFRALTADVISRTAFGSSYLEGKKFFEGQTKQMILGEKRRRSVYIPGQRFWPTPGNLRTWKIRREENRSITELIKRRQRSGTTEHDLLGLLMRSDQLQGNQRNLKLSTLEIIAECKTFFFAGHETTSTLLSWTVMLLGHHREWQELARAEVLKICGKSEPNAEMVNHLKIVGMILYETLRLYSPAVMLLRQTYKTMKLGELLLPEGTQLMLPVLAIHHDPAIWGEDAKEFNPQRFADGIARASKHPMAFMPFGMGPRICVGQNFALLESRIILAMILQRFSFRLSPTYKHAPAAILTMQPQYGMPIILEPL